MTKLRMLRRLLNLTCGGILVQKSKNEEGDRQKAICSHCRTLTKTPTGLSVTFKVQLLFNKCRYRNEYNGLCNQGIIKIEILISLNTSKCNLMRSPRQASQCIKGFFLLAGQYLLESHKYFFFLSPSLQQRMKFGQQQAEECLTSHCCSWICPEIRGESTAAKLNFYQQFFKTWQTVVYPTETSFFLCLATRYSVNFATVLLSVANKPTAEFNQTIQTTTQQHVAKHYQ